MPSIVPGFEYDIFISYRHKDNKGDHWVTEFVNSLNTELEATFKEDVSIYFDKNPYDGLLETHDVDDSLKKKLKCTIFIPIISQTYCDPKSFAWNNEFLAFKKLANEDQFGLKVTLANGNVTNRILPVRIHDLDSVDKSLLENEIGPLRSIDFVFKSAGVNRPLTPRDSREESTNKIFYRDQINKVANAIKELMAAMQIPTPATPSKKKVNTDFVSASIRKKISIAVASILTIGLLAFTLFYYIDWDSRLDSKIDKSIAVLPFKNMSGDKEQAFFSDGMTDEILSQLVKIGDLKVCSGTSSIQYRDSDKSLKDVARELSVANVLYGSVQKSGDRVRIIVNLVDASTDKHLWSESYDRDLSDVFTIQSEIAKNIARQLNIVLSAADKKQLEHIPTTNQQAYEHYLKALALYRDGYIRESVPFLDRAILLDSTFSLAYSKRAHAYVSWISTRWKDWEGKDQRAKNDLRKAMELAPDLVEVKISHAWVLNITERKYDEAISILQELRENYPKNVDIYIALGSVQRRKGLWRESIESYERALMLDPNSALLNYQTARLYSAIRDYNKAFFHYNRSGTQDNSVSSLFCQGKLSEGMQLLEESFKRTGDVVSNRRIHYYKREFNELFKDEYQVKEFSNDASELTYPELYYLMNDDTNMKKYAARMVESLLGESTKSPQDYYLMRALGVAYAYASECEKAIEAGMKALQIMPVSLDASKDGPENEFYLARIYLICGRYDEGLDKIEYLLTIPAADNANISVGLLKVDPFYDKLRNMPRFQKILKTEYKTEY